jgi:uncharacterized protein
MDYRLSGSEKVKQEQLDITLSSIEKEEKHYRFEHLERFLSVFEDLVFQGPVSAEIRIYRNREEIFLYGKLNACIELSCDRCLADSGHDIQKDFMYLLKPAAKRESLPGEMEITDDDVETTWYDGETIDIREMIAEQIRLEIPLRYLCKDECKGLCADCGCNLNEEQCACTHEEPAGPFAVLKELLA